MTVCPHQMRHQIFSVGIGGGETVGGCGPEVFEVADLEFETIFTPTVEVVPLPRTIDLEAA